MAKRKMRVLFAAFEAVPFMKTGGLGDVAGSLPQALLQAGIEARVMLPKFKTIPEVYRKKMTHVTDVRNVTHSSVRPNVRISVSPVKV